MKYNNHLLWALAFLFSMHCTNNEAFAPEMRLSKQDRFDLMQLLKEPIDEMSKIIHS